jgi:succinoglycan biosynthesis protein ExoV
MWDQIALRYFVGIGMEHWTGDNFGDQPLNQFLLPKLFPNLRQDVSRPKYILLGVGSILGIRHQCISTDEMQLPTFIYGSGYQYGTPTQLPLGSKVFCVRGRYTCEQLGFNKFCAVADPAILLPLFLSRDVEVVPGRIGLICSWNYGIPRRLNATALSKFDWPRGIKRRFFRLVWNILPNVISFTARTENNIIEWLRRLWSCERIVTEALHPAIVADAYGIPWKPLRWEPKWVDHFDMLGITKQPRTFALSNRELLEQRIKSLLDRREELIRYVDGISRSSKILSSGTFRDA